MFDNYVNFLKNKGFNLSVITAGALFIYVLAFYFFIHHAMKSPCCDEVYYINLTNELLRSGVGNYRDTLRTIGFPWLLSNLLFFSNSTRLPFNFIVFLFQSTLYFFSSIFVSCKFSKDIFLRNVIFLLLSVNIFILPYFGTVLTDAMATILIIVCLSLISNVNQNSIDKKYFFSCFFAVFSFSFAICIRPASIWVLVPLAVWLFSGICFKKLPSYLIAIFVGAVPLVVMLSINVTNFHVFTILPIDDLGSSQIKWGIENIKYATWTGGGGKVVTDFYPSNKLVNTTGSQLGIYWYLQYPFEAAKLLFIKFMAAFDWDFMEPYPASAPVFKWFPSLISYSILFYGVTAIFYHAVFEKNSLGIRAMPIVIFISWSAITLLTALELRFVLPMLTYFLIIGVIFINRIWKKSKKVLILLIALQSFFCCASIYFAIHVIRPQALNQF